jgi:bifunctional DNA primase/polymerase-like protein/primase-like protein
VEDYPTIIRIPLARGTKVPLLHRWSTLPPDSPLWAETFATHPDANVGIRLDTLVVADCDSVEAVEWWIENCPVGSPLASIGRPGRGTLWYRRPLDSGLRTCRIRPDLEIRTGPGAQQVIPPSLHPCGARYTWVNGDESTFARLPTAPEDWILAQTPPAAFSGAGGPGWDVVEAGGRDDFLTSVAGLLRARGMSEAGMAVALAAVSQAVCHPPKSAADIKRIAHSVSRYDAAVLKFEVERG